MPSAVSARSLRCCAIRSLGTAADRPPVSSAPVVFIFWPSIRISSGIKRFLPDKMLILVVSSGQRPFLPDVFWFGARSLVFSSVAPPVARVPSKGSLSLILPSRAGPLLTGPRTAMPFDRHTCHWLFASRRSDGANKWCKYMRFFTPFISFYSVGVKNGTFLHQILDSANTPAIRQYMLCKPKRRKSCIHARKISTQERKYSI